MRWLSGRLANVASKSMASAVVLTAIALVLVAVVDLMTGSEISFSLFYLGPIALLSWRSGLAGGITASAAGAALWYWVGMVDGQIFSRPLIPLWNALVRMGFFVIVSVLITRLRESMERERSLATTDPLTGLMNRRAFEDVASREIERARRTSLPISFTYLDLDDFKNVNDRMGHAAGDDVLRGVAAVVNLVLRRVDIKARLGGDEFALVMPDMGVEGAIDAIARLVGAFDAAGIRCSIGTAVFETPPSSVHSALEVVDSLMYEVKADEVERSKLRVVRDEPAPVPARL